MENGSLLPHFSANLIFLPQLPVSRFLGETQISPVLRSTRYCSLANIAAIEALQLVLPFLDSAEVQAEAAQAVTKIAGALRGADSEPARAALKKVLAVTTDATRRQAAEAALKQMDMPGTQLGR